MSLKDIKCYVFDMDGTIYLGEQVLPGAIELIQYLKDQGKRFFFFTNNSSRSPMRYVDKLNRLGFPEVLRKDILTSADVTIHYLKEHFTDPLVYLAGTPALEEQFTSSGIRLCPIDKSITPDVVVLGFDTTFNFDKADYICSLVVKGLPYLDTNIDRVCPLEGGNFLPDCGSMAKMIEHATGRLPKFMGKPFPETAQYILDVAGLKGNEVAVVGDRIYTDIATAYNNGLVAIGVLSGEMTMEDINNSDIKCDYLYRDTLELLEDLKNDR